MSIELNHIIIPARSKWASATFVASILDMPAGPQQELFVPVKVGNGVTLDYVDAERFGSRVQLTDAKYAGPWELTVLGAVTAPTAVLIRPDGYVAWAGDPTHPGLPDALTTWFGPPSAA